MPDDSIEAITVRLPDELLRIIDELIARGLFSNRSEAIRDFLRTYVAEARRG